jgi:hypothetical protein
MILTGENRRTARKTCPSSTLSTTNPTWINPGANPGLRDERPVTTRLSYATAITFNDFECYARSVMYRFRMILSVNRDYFLHSINYLVFVMNYCIFFETGTVIVINIYMKMAKNYTEYHKTIREHIHAIKAIKVSSSMLPFKSMLDVLPRHRISQPYKAKFKTVLCVSSFGEYIRRCTTE